MAEYTMKSPKVEAFVFKVGLPPIWFREAKDKGLFVEHVNHGYIINEDGDSVPVVKGDYIIRSKNGMLQRCCYDFFHSIFDY